MGKEEKKDGGKEGHIILDILAQYWYFASRHFRTDLGMVIKFASPRVLWQMAVVCAFCAFACASRRVSMPFNIKRENCVGRGGRGRERERERDNGANNRKKQNDANNRKKNSWNGGSLGGRVRVRDSMLTSSARTLRTAGANNRRVKKSARDDGIADDVLVGCKMERCVLCLVSQMEVCVRVCVVVVVVPKVKAGSRFVYKSVKREKGERERERER